MPVEFASASIIEPAKEGDLVMIDESGLPAPVMGARERLLLCRSCTDLMCGLQDDEDAGGPFQLLKLKDMVVNDRVTDELNALDSRLQHRIDFLA